MRDHICTSCEHFISDPDDAEFGECRRFPPVYVKDESGETTVAFPIVHESAFCGEFVRRVS